MSELETPKDVMHIKTHVVLNPSVLKVGEACYSFTNPSALISSFLVDLFPHRPNHYLTGLLCLSKMAQHSLYVPKCVGVTLLLLF